MHTRSVCACTIAHAHWPNVGQTDLNVVVVIIGVVVAKVVALLRKFR